MAGQAGVQTSVNTVPAPGVAGDFASANPYFTALIGPGAFTAGPAGVAVGTFVWATSPDDANGAPGVVNNFGTGPVTGFIHREQQALITAFLGFATQLVPVGYPVTVYNGGDFWVVNNGATQALPGQKCYANLGNGSASFAATGSPTQGGTSTASTIAASTFSVTGSITGNIMTVTAVGSGTVVAGATVSGTGVVSGSQVQSQLTPLLPGEALGGVGRYYVSIAEQATAAGITISGTYGTLTIGGTVTGTFALNDVLAVSGSVVANTFITQLLTGVGGAGTYVVNQNTVVSSQAINVNANVETKWFCQTSGLNGEIVKITDHPQG